MPLAIACTSVSQRKFIPASFQCGHFGSLSIVPEDVFDQAV